jgi:hypothetical protein
MDLQPNDGLVLGKNLRRKCRHIQPRFYQATISSPAGSDTSRVTERCRRRYFLSELAGAGDDAVVDAAGVELVEEPSELEEDLPESDEEGLLSLEDFGLALP